MVKLRAGNTILLGLSNIDLDRLREGKPTMFSGAELGPDLKHITVAIMHGETEAEIIMELEGIGIRVGPATKQ